MNNFFFENHAVYDTGVLISHYPDQEGNKLQRQKILMFICPIYNRNWRSISTIYIYRVSHKLRSLLRESVPYVKIYRYDPKHLCPKLNGYGDNGHRKVWASGVSTYCTPSVTLSRSFVHSSWDTLYILLLLYCLNDFLMCHF